MKENRLNPNSFETIREPIGEFDSKETISNVKGSVKSTHQDLIGNGRHPLDSVNLANQEIKVLQQSNQELMRSNRDLESFAYVVSHDLKEPLRMVSTFAKLLETRYREKLDNDAGKFIEQIVSNANRMSALISDLLDYSRLQTKGQSFQLVDLNKVREDAIANLDIICKETQTRIYWDSLPMVTGDAYQLTSLFQNLIGNSIKFRKTTETPVIHIGMETPTKKEWLFFVKDNGIGIDPKNFEKIFTIFNQMQSRDKYPGTGIGLATCKKIVERHGGHIWVDSEPGKGSKFYFTISR